MKRSRGRGRRQGNSSNRNYESNGPDLKVRGNAQSIYEKYQSLAQDALSSGELITAENYLQHADHFTRVLNERESIRKERSSENKSETNASSLDKIKKPIEDITESNLANVSKNENEEEKVSEPQV